MCSNHKLALDVRMEISNIHLTKLDCGSVIFLTASLTFATSNTQGCISLVGELNTVKNINSQRMNGVPSDCGIE